MVRPEPCVLFAQSFVHSHLDEYVDEIIFAEPVVITACEFLEQNASSASPLITLIGATSPPSFALEVFVQCEGEPRFRRLCQPFLYSHSSSNVLELEAIVTNHLVVRGSYRSLTLVIYGNTAEDLGQFSVEYDLDSSLVNLVSSPSEGKLEDLPPALHSTKLTFEESLSPLKFLTFPISELDLSLELKQFLYLALKICQLAIPENSVHKIASSVVSVVSSYVTCELSSSEFTWDQHRQDGVVSHKKESCEVLTEAQNELMNIYNLLQVSLGDRSDELQGERMVIKLEAESATPELLVDLFNQSFALKRNCPALGLPLLSQNENMILGLSMIFLFCSGGESCFHFVNGGGMGQLAYLFCKENSTAVTLMLLGVIERATRHAVGVEGFLGWWPRQDENVPSGTSECYSHLVKLLLKKQRHDVASLATYLLRRLRFYEIASRYESAVLSVLGSLSGVARLTHVGLNSLVAASSQLKKLLKLLSLRGPVDNPSPVACTTKSLILGEPEGLLSYQATVNLIAVSKCCISFDNIDTNLLSFLKERGFLPLSAALLSSPILRSKTGTIVDIVADIVASIEAILLSFLSCRSGIVFLLHQPEVAIAVVRALKGFEDIDKADCVPLRYATVLISKGFLCRTQEVGIIIELHLRVVNAIDRLITAIPHSEEFLWVLWELCDLSRSDAGRQALLALQHFPEVVLAMIEALCSVKELQPTALNSGTSPLNLALFHAAAEIFEVIVTDSTASSLASWIVHAVELHKALHSSSPGTNRKDAPTRLLEWIDAGVVYHRNGAVGLLKYAAVLASGGDAHLSSANILVSDTIDVENVVGDSSNGSDVQVIENLLGKLVSDKYFEGVALRDSSIAQLTTVFRILAFISENSAVAAALYEESAVTLIYVVVVNCKFMLERSSNTYDYLVDEGLEGNSMSNLLFERSREQSIIDLLIPCLLLLVTLLKKLQEAKDQHRNTKLLNALLRLHREVSPKLAACATDLSSPYPGSALGLGAVCRLVVSALACWPVFGWTPGLFHCLLESVQATSQLALGPKEACSLFCLLGDLFPEEDIWLWKNGMPSLSALRTLGVGTVLGPQREKDVDWYLQSTHVAVLLNRLVPFLDKIAQIVLHFAFTALVVVQDMLRVVIIRIACLKPECACVLLRPMISWMHDHTYTSSPLIDTDVLKVQRLLDFIASLLEYPCTKALLLKEGAVRILIKALESLSDAFSSDRKLFLESRVSNKNNISLLSWCLPVCKSLALLICDLRAPPEPSGAYEQFSDGLDAEDFSLIVCHLLKLCKVLPAGRELQACLMALKELASCNQGRSAFVSLLKTQTSSFEDLETGRDEREGNCNIFGEYDWKKAAPFLYCLKNLLRSISTKDGISVCAVVAVKELCLGALSLCEEGKNVEGISVLKFLFGLPHSLDDMEDCSGENLEDIIELLDLLNNNISEDGHVTSSNTKIPLYLVKEFVESMLLLLQKPSASVKMENMILNGGFPSVGEVLVTLKIFPPHLDLLLQSLPLMSHMDDEAGFFLSRTKKPDGHTEGTGNYFSLGSLTDKFLWECPDTSDRVSMAALPVKRKVTSVEGPSRRSRGDNSGVENVGTNTFSRGLGTMGPVSSGSSRRDTFRQRKPNTSRPPSMHVDDYVARERNIDVSSGSNVVGSIQRGGSTGGRPPSIHVDEFMARQKERQNPTSLPVAEAVVPQIRKSPVENEHLSDKGNQPRPLKADLDDDLQEIDIIFDEEPESDDKLPFPQPDENVASAHVITGENSPHSVVEETESSQFSVGLPPPSDTDRDSRYEFPLRRSISRSEMSLNREPSINSEQSYPPRDLEKPKPLYHEPTDETKKQLLPATTNLPQFSAQIYNKGSTSSPVQGDSRMPIFYPRDTPQLAANAPPVSGSHGYFPLNQPPLPSLPPPPTIAAMPSQTHESIHTQSSSYGQPPLPSAYPLQAFDVSGSGNALPFSSPFTDSLNHPFPSLVNTESLSISNNSPGASLTTPHPMMDSKYAWASVSSSRLHEDATGSSASTRPPPPLPPTPPPYSAQSSTSQLSQYNKSSIGIQLPLHLDHLGDARLGTSFSMPSFIPPLMLGRPSSVPGTSFTGTPMQQQQQQTQNLLGLSSLPSPSAPQSIQSMQPRPPLQPPLPPRPPHLPLQPRPLEQAVPLQQSSAHVQLQPLQAPQQIHMPQMHLYYQTQGQQQEPLSQPQTHQEDGGPQQQQDSGTTLQQYFSSPEAIQALLSDKEKLCQLLVQYPKLMQMLQERLGQI